MLIAMLVLANVAYVIVRLARAPAEPVAERLITDPEAIAGADDAVYRQCRRQGHGDGNCRCLSRGVADGSEGMQHLVRLTHTHGADGMPAYIAALPVAERNQLLGPMVQLRALMESCVVPVP